MNKGFYRAFEERHRGPSELIKSRLRVYLPFLEPLNDLYTDQKAVDLGCGRGEWLQLLGEAGIDAQGVDLDDDMLAVCRNLGLNVQTHEAVSFLEELSEESQVAVSGFHVAEHIPFSDLQTLVQTAFRVLKPGGLLILETPNPENLLVGSCNFYLDPTHRRPIPPLLLSFLAEHAGFARVKVLRLQESPELRKKEAPTVLDVLTGVSPDYSVVAQKGASPQHMKLFDAAFTQDYGLTVEALANKLDARIARGEQAEITLNKLRNTRIWRFLEWVNRKIDGRGLE